MKQPWLHIVGIGEDGLAGLGDASKKAIGEADFVIGSPRQLALANAENRGESWPIPFSLTPVLEKRGQLVVMLASGDPFWHGAGGSISRHLTPDEWRCYPSPSSFSLAAARLGWRLEEICCRAVHAAPKEIILPDLQAGAKLICLLRDADAIADIFDYATMQGFSESRFTVLAALGGANEYVGPVTADSPLPTEMPTHPVALAIHVQGGKGISLVPGRPEDCFQQDGQITKSPARAVTLALLAPREGEILWDLGGGSGSISVEWCLAGRHTRAISVERRLDRAANIAANRDRFGLPARMFIETADSLDFVQASKVLPDAIFIGGGLSDILLETLWSRPTSGCRLVVNAVTLESQAIVMHWQALKGGSVSRLDFAQPKVIGDMHVWQPVYPITQWVVTL